MSDGIAAEEDKNRDWLELFGVFDVVPLLRRAPRTFAALASPPDWFRLFGCGPVNTDGLHFDHNPFLSHFLTDAEEFWGREEDGRLGSGPWNEQFENGEELAFEASAVRVGTRACLLIQRLGVSFEAQRQLLQGARDSALEVDRLVALHGALNDARRAAELSSRRKSRFLTVMSHEIRTPLNGVIGMTELILATQLNSEQREYAELARSSARSLLASINEVLDLAKVESGRLELRNEPFDLHEALREPLKLLAATAQVQGLELVCDLDPAVPRWVVGDADRLVQVLLNLVGNAVKFTTSGEVVVRLRAVEREALLPDRIGFAVQDTGCGIAEADRARIFEAFEQGGGEARSKGTGLGLSIAAGLIRRMGGELQLSSSPGEGSTFCFSLTLPGARSPAPAPAAPLAGQSILIIDDGPSSRPVLARMLTALGARVESHADAGQGLTELVASQPSAIVIDTETAGFDARAWADAIGSLPLVLLVPMSRAARTRPVLASFNAAALLTKPVFSVELVDALVAPPTTVSAEAPTGPAPAPHLRALVADDDDVSRLFVSKLLRRWGFSVVAAEDGAAALELLERRHFDILLVDFQMPRMGGLELTRRLRSSTTHAHLPIVGLTGSAMDAEREQGRLAGMNAHLIKPLDPDRLREVIGDLLPAAAQPDARSERDHHRGPAVLIDGELLDRSGGNVDLARELVRMARETIPGLLEIVGSGVREGDGAKVRAGSHRLRGTLETISAKPAAIAAAALELHARSGADRRWAAGLEDLEREINRLLPVFEALLEGAKEFGTG